MADPSYRNPTVGGDGRRRTTGRQNPGSAGDKANAGGHFPVALEPGKAISLAKGMLKFPVRVSLGLYGEAKVGSQYLATDGRRLLLGVSHVGIIYLLNPTQGEGGQFYIQSVEGFVGEITTAAHAIGGRNALAAARLAELEIQLLIGIVGATSGVGFFAVVGSDAVKFVVENREQFGKWSKTLAAVLGARTTLKRYAPTLYEKLFEATLVVLVADVAPETPGEIPAEALARMTGAIIGKIGKDAAEGKFSKWMLVWTVLSELAKKCLAAMPKAISITTGEYKESAEKIIERLQSAGVTITREDVQSIFDEIRRHPKEIGDSLRQILEASK